MTQQYAELVDIDGISRKIPADSLGTVRIYGLSILQIIALARNFEHATGKTAQELTAHDIIEMKLKRDWRK